MIIDWINNKFIRAGFWLAKRDLFARPAKLNLMSTSPIPDPEPIDPAPIRAARRAVMAAHYALDTQATPAVKRKIIEDLADALASVREKLEVVK